MLELIGLDLGYRGEAKVKNACATFERGALTGIAGANGCGKTTLLLGAAGLLRPMAGRVLLDGAPISAMRPRERARRIALMPQSRDAPNMTARVLASQGRYPHERKPDWTKVDAALARAGAEAFAARRVDELSGGERQRAYLAMLLSQDADCLLLDEPTAALDPASQAALMRLLRELSREGRCVVCVLHDLPLLARFCDRALLMRKGEVAAFGAPGELIASGRMETALGVRLWPVEKDGETVYAQQ